MHSAPNTLPATILSAETIAGDVRLLRIRPDFGFTRAEPGSHLSVALKLGELDRIRSYSIVSDDGGAWTIAVRRLENGRGGSRFMATLQAGERIQVIAPKNHFQLSGSSPEYLLIAGGIGVTPILSMARALAKRGRVRMLYAGRTRESMAFLDELSALLGDRLSVVVEAEGAVINFAQEFARLDAEGEAYMCGPNGMLTAARSAWRDAGRLPALLRFETFGAGGAREPEAFDVHVRDHNLTLHVPSDASLLDTLARHGIQLANDCQRGECGLCVVEVVEATALDHRCVFLSEEQRHEGRKLCACVSRATGQMTIDTFYRPSLARSDLAAAAAE